MELHDLLLQKAIRHWKLHAELMFFLLLVLHKKDDLHYVITTVWRLQKKKQKLASYQNPACS